MPCDPDRTGDLHAKMPKLWEEAGSPLGTETGDLFDVLDMIDSMGGGK
jgi:hypothetical protein